MSLSTNIVKHAAQDDEEREGLLFEDGTNILKGLLIVVNRSSNLKQAGEA